MLQICREPGFGAAGSINELLEQSTILTDDNKLIVYNEMAAGNSGMKEYRDAMVEGIQVSCDVL